MLYIPQYAKPGEIKGDSIYPGGEFRATIRSGALLRYGLNPTPKEWRVKQREEKRDLYE